MNTKHIFIVAAIVSMVMVSSCSTPQTSTEESADPSSPETRQRTPEQFISQLSTRLGLTPEQETQIGPIVKDQMTQMQALFEKYRGQGQEGMSSFQQERQQLQTDTEYRFAEFLTDAQLQEYRKMIEEQQQRLQTRRSGRSESRSGRGGGRSSF